MLFITKNSLNPVLVMSENTKHWILKQASTSGILSLPLTESEHKIIIQGVRTI
jgi:hypothetical protein